MTPQPEAEDVLSVAAQWRAAGEQVALATVTETWGSSPRPAGSQMAVTASGRMAGSVSGGCIEGAVADAAMANHPHRHAAAAGFRRQQRARLGSRPRLRRQGEGVRGEADVTPDLLAALAAGARGQAAGRAGDAPALAASRSCCPTPLPPPALDAAAAARAGRRPQRHRQRRRGRLVPARPQPAAAPGRGRRGAYRPGAGAAGRAARLRRRGGRPAPRLRQPRSASPTSPSPPTGRTRRWTRCARTARTAVVTLTHDPKLDDPALDRALKSPAFYIGALGSRKTHAARLARLRELGHGEAALARIRGPVGPRHRGGDRAGDRALHPGRDRRGPPRRRARPQAGPGSRGLIFGTLRARRGRGRHPGAHPAPGRPGAAQGLRARRRRRSPRCARPATAR